MKNTILKLIASSKNSYELTDRICELWEEEREKKWKEIFNEIYKEVVAPANSYKEACERLKEFGKIKCGLKSKEKA